MVTIELIAARSETMFIVQYYSGSSLYSRLMNSGELTAYLTRIGNTSISIRVI